MLKTYYHENKNELFKYSVDIILQSIKKILYKQDKIVLGLCGGRNVPIIYQLISQADIPWKDVHLFMIDERLVPENHEQYNYTLVKKNIVDKLINNNTLPIENIHPFQLNTKKTDFGVNEYEQELKGASIEGVIKSPLLLPDYRFQKAFPVYQQ